MSSIKPPGHRGAHTPGSINKDDGKSLTEMAERLGMNPGGNSGESEGAGKGEKGEKGGKGKGVKAPMAGIGEAAGPAAKGGLKGAGKLASPALPAATGDTLSTAKSKPGTKPDAAPSQLPDPRMDDSAGAAKAQKVDTTAASTAATSVDQARTQLATDIASGSASAAKLTQDVTSLKQALTAAGVDTPVSQVIHDIVDAQGKGTKPSQALQDAAKAAGVDLSRGDSTDAKVAKTALDAATAKSPSNPAAITVATAHVVRTEKLAGKDPGVALKSAVDNTPAANKNGLAALYAQAAKNGVDISGKNDDQEAAALNKGATRKMEADRKEAAKVKASEGGGGGGASKSGGGAGTGHDATGKGKDAYGTGKPANTQQYGSIPKTGPGSSAGGWDTTGNEPIAPNPNNPIDFEKQYGIKGGFSSQPLDELLQHVPQLTADYPNIKEMLINAANSVSPPIPPELLLTTLGVETSFAQNKNNGQDGPFQFIESTFAAFGKGDRTNMQDAANACANYYHTLLQQNGNDLFASMRDYNGDVNKGASNTYQKDQQAMFNGNLG